MGNQADNSLSASGGPELPKIGLQRGGAWSFLTIRPPHLKGPQFHLELDGDTLRGSISGGAVPGGTLHIKIDESGAHGYGPMGSVSLDFFEENGAKVVEGQWNGGRVHLAFAPESVKGTIAVNSFFATKSDPFGTGGMAAARGTRFGPAAFGAGGVGAEFIDPLPQDVSCEYYLNLDASNGAMVGGSTCGAMPQETRLEVPEVAQAWLTDAQLMTILVAVLATPPALTAESTSLQHTSPSNQTPRN